MIKKIVSIATHRQLALRLLMCTVLLLKLIC